MNIRLAAIRLATFSARTQETANTVFGRKTSKRDLEQMAGKGAGFGVKLTKVRHQPKVTGGYEHQLDVHGTIHHRGEEVGNFDKAFRRKGKHVNLHLSNIEVEPEHQGQGHSTRWLRNTIRHARKRGVHSMSLTASADGKYAWARAGFQWGKKEAEKKGKELHKYLTKHRGMGHDEARRVVSQVKHHPWKVASLRHKGEHVGRDFLLNHGSDWDGDLEFHHGHAGFRHAHRRMGLHIPS